MSTSRIRKATAVFSATALIGAGGLSAAQAATTDASKGSSAGRPAMRHGGPLSSTQLRAIATQLGVSSTELKAALQASRPARPAAGTGPGKGDGMATALATALGADIAKVKAILDANRPAKPARRTAAATPPAKPDSTKLVAALASGLGIDQATVQAAFDKLEAARKADHTAREAAMYAAVAAQLDVSADAVKAAFEANRPAKPGA
jgi:hypothetical protein